MDGMIWGAALATAMPFLQRVARFAVALVWTSVALLLLMLLTTGNSDDYYRQDGILINLGVVAFVLGSSYGVRAAPVTVLSWAPLRLLGRMSLAIYIWHYPVFFAVARWNAYNQWGWQWLPKVLLAFAITAVFAVAAQRLLEQPLQRWLGRTRGGLRRR